jgi:hypothetical protein
VFAPVLRLHLLWIVPLLFWLALRYYPAGGLSASLRQHPLYTWRETQAVITDAYRRHLPIVGPRKAMWVAYYVFLDDATLLENGQLPPRGEKVVRLDKQRMLLSSDPSRYTAEAALRLTKSKRGRACVLALRQQTRFLVPPKRALPEHCVPPRS